MFATRCEEPTPWKRPWCWERLKAGGEGDDRGWDGWMASRTQWTWVWVNSGSWWWTGRPGVLWSMGSQRVGHDWATELNWRFIEMLSIYNICKFKMYNVRICFMYILQNDDHDKVVHTSVFLHNYHIFVCGWWHLRSSLLQLSSIIYGRHVVCYIPRTYSSYS